MDVFISYRRDGGYDDIDEQFFSSDTIFSAGYVIYSARF